MQGRAGSFKIGVNRKKILPVITICMLVVTGLSTVFINNQRFVDAVHPTYTFGEATLALDDTSIAKIGCVSMAKRNSTSYFLFIGGYTGGELYALYGSSPNFTTASVKQGISNSQIMQAGNPPSYIMSNGTVVVVYEDVSETFYYSFNTSGGTWNEHNAMGLDITADNARMSPHIVEFDGYYWMTITNTTSDNIETLRWGTNEMPDQYGSGTVCNTLTDSAYVHSDIVVYDDVLWCFYGDRANENMSYRTLASANASWSSETEIYDWSGNDVDSRSRPCAIYDYTNDVIVLYIMAYGGTTGNYGIMTYDSVNWSSATNYTGTGGICMGGVFMDNYLYVFNRTGSDFDVEYYTASGGAGTGGDAEISVSCSGLSGPIGGNNTHINFVTTNDSKTNVDSDEWLHVTYDAESGNASITELHILWNASIGGQVAALDNLHMCIWNNTGQPTNFTWNSTNYWTYVGQFTTSNGGNLTVNSSHWSGDVGSTFDYGEGIYFMFRIDNLGSLAIGSYSNSASSHKVYITGQT